MFLKFLKWFLGLFSPYVHPLERKVDRFFKHVKSTDSFGSVKEKLLKLMQQDLVVTNVWMEKKFKGYTYLDKKTRRVMYGDVKMMVEVFKKFCVENPADLKLVTKRLESAGLSFPHGSEEQIKYIDQIMNFLKPGRYYHYIKTASFGKLLRDPQKAKLEGDCNQIVTLYAYLFSLKFPIDQLQIKLLPEHVCLHFRTIDVEATNATYQKYREDGQILPITEIISTNLLDLADFRENVQEISPRVMVKSAQLAYAISSLKPLVKKNLQIAYTSLAVAALRVNDFKTAIFYFEKVGDRKRLHSVYHNAAIYYMKQHFFKKARYYADQAGDGELRKIIYHNEGVYLFKAGRIDSALKIFTELGDEKMKKACYGNKYNKLVDTVRNVKTVADLKKHKSTYQKMLDLARKMGDERLISSLEDTLRKV